MLEVGNASADLRTAQCNRNTPFDIGLRLFRCVNPDARTVTYPNACPCSHTYANPNACPNSHAYTYPNTCPCSHVYASPDTCFNSHAYTDPNTHPCPGPIPSHRQGGPGCPLSRH